MGKVTAIVLPVSKHCENQRAGTRSHAGARLLSISVKTRAAAVENGSYAYELVTVATPRKPTLVPRCGAATMAGALREVDTANVGPLFKVPASAAASTGPTVLSGT